MLRGLFAVAGSKRDSAGEGKSSPAGGEADDGQHAAAPAGEDISAHAGLAAQLRYPRLPRRKAVEDSNFSVVLMFAFLWLYVGAVWSPDARLAALNVAVLSCDAGVPAPLRSSVPPLLAGGAVGSGLLARSVLNVSSPAAHLLGWQPFTCKAQAGAPSCAAVASACRAELVRAVERGDVWSALYVPPEFTASLASNIPLLRLNASAPRMEHILGTGRSYSTYTYVKALVGGTVAALSTSLGTTLLADPTLSALLRPAYFLAPVGLTETDLHPVSNFGQAYCCELMCVVLWIGSSFLAAILLPLKSAEQIEPGGTRSVSRREALRVIGARLAVTVAYCFAHSIALVAVLLCLGGYSDSEAHPKTVWAHNPGVAIAYGAYMCWAFTMMNAVLHVILLATIGHDAYPPFVTFFLILQQTASAGVFATALSNRFFKIGLGFPMYYGVRAFRTIFFGGQENWMPINWMVPTVWNAGCTAAYVFCMLRRMQRRADAPAKAAQHPMELDGVMAA